MKKAFEFGLLGLGDGARNHMGGFRRLRLDDIRVSTVCARDLEKAEAFAAQNVMARGTRRHFADVREFLADPEIDAVIVATPDALHREHAIAAMRAGKHLLVEKPMALSKRDAEDMARVAQHCGVRLGVGFHLRHHAGHRALREALRVGAVGDVSHVHLEWSTRSMGADNWRAVEIGGWFALAALGSHALDLVAWLTGARRANVFATKVTQNAAGRDERVAMHLELDGIAASIRVSVVDRPSKYLRISGSNGFVECRDTLGGRGEGEIVFQDGERLAFVPVNPYAAQIADFVAAVREDRDPDANAAAGILNADWLAQAGESMNVQLP